MSLPNFNEAINFKKFTDPTEQSLGTIYLTGGGFVDRPFNGCGVDSKFGWEEMVWKKTPNRAGGFAFTNMDNIEVGLVARCEINIKYMNIKDYEDLRKIIGRERYFWAKFFDIDKGEWVFRQMYCSENSISKLHTLKQSLIGVMDYSIKLVGTNNDVNQDATYSVTYNSNGGSGTVSSKTGLTWGSQVKIDSGSTLSKSGYNFVGWSKIKNGELSYRPNQSTTLWDNITLYAVWEEV